MNGRPSAAQLTQAVAAFQAQAQAASPAEQGARAYLAKVAANLQDTVAREAQRGPAADAAERLRLQHLLATDQPHLPSLQGQLCERIASGDIGMHTPGLIDHLWRTTLAQVAVDQPRYSTFLRRAAEHPADTETPAPDTSPTRITPSKD